MFEERQIRFILLIIVILGITPKNINAIYGGHYVRSAGENPFMVHIQYKDKYICGGAIVDKIHVITSGQCFNPESNLKDYKIISGDIVSHTNWRFTDKYSIKLSDTYSVKYAWRSRGFHMVGTLAYNDIAIFTVSKNFDTKLIPLKLAPIYQLPKPGNIGKLTGWGACSDQSTTCSRILKYLYVPISDQDLCIERANRWWNLHAEHLCIEHNPPDGISGASRGDIGSVLSFDGFLLGIVTLPTADTHSNRPDIYTKVGVFRHFYEETIRKEEADKSSQSSPEVCRSVDEPSTSYQGPKTLIGHCSFHEYFCARVNQILKEKQTQEQSQPDIIIPDSPQNSNELDTDSPEDSNEQSENSNDSLQSSERSTKRRKSSQIREVSPKKFCVASGNIQEHPERYHMIKPQSYATVASQNNIQPGDVEDMRCRENVDDEDEFINFLLFGETRVPPHYQQSETQQKFDARSFNQEVTTSGLSEIEQNSVSSTTETQQYSSFTESPHSASDVSSGDESDSINYRPRPLPHEPDFTPPNSLVI